ncbi:hypothetical protein HYV70_01950 [Candidatus Uhrbacteria bacterium]|nr:hypothetical protein [Candidatus Uhrbacteria bacterium]
MGLFKRKESPQELKNEASEMGIELNTYDAEKEDEPTNAEMGRERVDKMMAGAKELWSKMTGKLSSLAGGAMERAKDLLFKGVGYMEKDAKKTVKEAKAVSSYVAESGREAVDIGKAGLEWGKDAAKRDYAQTKEDVKDLLDKAKMLGYTGSVLALMGTVEGYRMVKELGKKGVDIASEKFKKAADVVKETGINFAVDGMVLALEGALKAEEMGIDAKKWLEGKGRKGLEIYERAKSGAKELWKKGVEAKNNFWNRAKSAKDGLMNWYNRESLRMAREAELRGEVAELKEQLSRVTALVEARNRLDSVEPEIDLTSFLDENVQAGEAQAALA